MKETYTKRKKEKYHRITCTVTSRYFDTRDPFVQHATLTDVHAQHP